MKFSEDELYEIGKKVYREHGVDITYQVNEGLGNWAAESECDDYAGGEADVIAELESYEAECEECGELVRLADIKDGICPECKR